MRPKAGGRRREIWKASKGVWKTCNRQRFVWKSLEQNTRVLEKLGKRLGGGLYSATVGSCHQRPPTELESSLRGATFRSNPGAALVRKRRSNEAVRPAKGDLSVWKGGWLVSSNGTSRRPVRNSQ